ncbi:hypothetical protein [Geobacter sp. DSM 9736]|uniref:hypothetical protein n=1 Tax=Geobacter sp. DSM 9736 TaxID=1277350 RepID=UPI000B5123A9|nr:hypothetical protein [Geobacter sp. DSM 9736]SNB45545.1 hypothetical protein SAMN06269301_0963 [Geobacter sp. DSM 9736]
MQTMVCVHYQCPQCGEQKHCLDSKLRSDEPLVCSSGHDYFVEEWQRKRINHAFEGSYEAELDLYLTAKDVRTIPEDF